MWSTSLMVGVAALGTVAFTIGIASEKNLNLLSQTAVKVVPTVAVAPTSLPKGEMQLHASADASVQLDKTATVRSANTVASSVSGMASGILALSLGLAAAAWARIRNTQKANVLDRLDLESGLAMASAAGEEVTYHFIVANAKFMLYDEEHAMELLREKRRFLKEKGLPQDFWIVPNPEFLDRLPDIDKRVLKPCAALVSTDEKWILFMKLRYDRVLMGSFTGSTNFKKELATKGGDALAAVPKFDLPKDWEKTVPYPKYSEDWFYPFLVSPPSA